jgi:myo-inositol-1(or 4)-monophosphatase
MTTIEPAELHEVAREAARAGARVARRWWERVDGLAVQEKAGPWDLVSRADRDTEHAIRTVLAKLRPDDGILGEEGGEHHGTSGIRWAVDPIDGTTSFLYGREDWAVSVAALTDDARPRALAAVVMEPALDRITEAHLGGATTADGREAPALQQTDLARALVEINIGDGWQRARAGAMIDRLVPQVRDVRRGGSAAAALARTATGLADAAWLPGLHLWDYAGGVLLVTQAGGWIGDLSGHTGDALPAGDILAASPVLWPLLHRIIAPAYAAG